MGRRVFHKIKCPAGGRNEIHSPTCTTSHRDVDGCWHNILADAPEPRALGGAGAAPRPAPACPGINFFGLERACGEFFFPLGEPRSVRSVMESPTDGPVLFSSFFFLPFFFFRRPSISAGVHTGLLPAASRGKTTAGGDAAAPRSSAPVPGRKHFAARIISFPFSLFYFLLPSYLFPVFYSFCFFHRPVPRISFLCLVVPERPCGLSSWPAFRRKSKGFPGFSRWRVSPFQCPAREAVYPITAERLALQQNVNNQAAVRLNNALATCHKSQQRKTRA